MLILCMSRLLHLILDICICVMYIDIISKNYKRGDLDYVRKNERNHFGSVKC